jgi:hypothetical protein
VVKEIPFTLIRSRNVINLDDIRKAKKGITEAKGEVETRVAEIRDRYERWAKDLADSMERVTWHEKDGSRKKKMVFYEGDLYWKYLTEGDLPAVKNNQITVLNTMAAEAEEIVVDLVSYAPLRKTQFTLDAFEKEILDYAGWCTIDEE